MYYVICPNDDVEEIRVDKIIDVVERGEISEIERLGFIFRRTELPLQHRLLNSKFRLGTDYD